MIARLANKKELAHLVEPALFLFNAFWRKRTLAPFFVSVRKNRHSLRTSFFLKGKGKIHLTSISSFLFWACFSKKSPKTEEPPAYAGGSSSTLISLLVTTEWLPES